MDRHLKKTIFLALVCLAFPAFAQKKAVLAIDGKTRFSIAVPAQAGTEEESAAELLKWGMNIASFAKIGITHTDTPPALYTIWIAPAQFPLPKGFKGKQPNLKPDGYQITVQPEQIVILSGGKMGSYNAVVHLLEKYFNFRYYSPEHKNFSMLDTMWLPAPLLITEQPVNSLRIINGAMTEQHEAFRKWHRLDHHREEFAEGYYVHTFNKLVPWDIHFEGHPEYFAEMNGKRIIDQLCMTNADVLETVVQKLRGEMAQQPRKTLWSVSQNDNFSYCQCTNCAKITAEEGSPAGPLIRFVNQVAAAFPDKTISTLAYQFSRHAPQKTKPAPNVQIMLCTIELNRSKAIEDDPLSASFVKDIVDWGKICNNIYLWDYTVNFSHHVSPFPNLHVLQPNIRFFTQNGVRQHFQQSNTGKGHEFSELKTYLISRLLWNPDVNIDSVRTDFLRGYYGNAAGYIEKYLQHLEAEVQKTGEWLDIYGHPVAHKKTFLSAENMALYRQWFDAAEQAVAEDPICQDHVKIARLPIQYAEIEIAKNDVFGPNGFFVEEEENKFVLRNDKFRLLEDFYTVCQLERIKNLNESGLTYEDYYQTSRRFLRTQVDGNLAFRRPVSAMPLPASKYSEGALTVLTNGVQGSNDFKVHWLGWEAVDFELVLDLGAVMRPGSVQMSTLYDPKSWILHPKSVTCLVSEDGINYRTVQTQTVAGEQRTEPVVRSFVFEQNLGQFRYVKFAVEGTKELFDWHPSAGGGSWVFVDEIVIK